MPKFNRVKFANFLIRVANKLICAEQAKQEKRAVALRELSVTLMTKASEASAAGFQHKYHAEDCKRAVR